MPPVAVSVVRLCNQALNNIGVSATIAAIDENTKEARACALWYETSRNAVLVELEWGFAQRRVTLAATTATAPEPWGYEYAYPTDCLKLTAVDDGRIVTRSAARIPWLVEGRGIPDGTGDDIERRVILSDQPDAAATYTALVSNPALYPPAFQQALGWRLAADIAVPLTVAPPLQDRAERYYLMALSKARANDLREGQSRPDPESEFIQARGDGTGLQYPYPWNMRQVP